MKETLAGHTPTGRFSTTDFFEDEMRGYRLLKASHLTRQEKRNILTQTNNSTEFVKIRRALRTLFADDGSELHGHHHRRSGRGLWWQEHDEEEEADPTGWAENESAYWQDWWHYVETPEEETYFGASGMRQQRQRRKTSLRPMRRRLGRRKSS